MPLSTKSIVAFAALTLTVAGIGFTAQRVSFAADPAPATQPVDPKPVNTKCPVAGDDIDPKITTVYKGKTYAFCCQSCVKKFTDNPEKYAGTAK